MTSRSVIADNLKLNLVETGSGRPMLFQHGLGGDAAQPVQVFPEGIGFRCITVECRGHGLSELGPEESVTLANFADDLIQIIEDLKIAPLPIGGISMGAALALRIAVKRPDLVSALVIARPAWTYSPAPENLRAYGIVGELLTTKPQGVALQTFEASPVAGHLADHGPDNLASLRGFFSREPASATATLLSRISADGPGVSEADVAALDLPTLVIGHEKDVAHPISFARQLATDIPNARFVEITPKAVNPAAYRHDFSAAIAAFLKDV